MAWRARVRAEAKLGDAHFEGECLVVFEDPCSVVVELPDGRRVAYRHADVELIPPAPELED